MHDAGFESSEMHDRLGGAVDADGRLHVQPLRDDEEPEDENFVVYVVGRT
jgi:hypothetical protein